MFQLKPGRVFLNDAGLKHCDTFFACIYNCKKSCGVVHHDGNKSYTPTENILDEVCITFGIKAMFSPFPEGDSSVLYTVVMGPGILTYYQTIIVFHSA